MLSPASGHVAAVHPVGDRDVDRPAVGVGDREVVVQADGLVDARQRVEAVLARGTDAEVEVDLGRRAHRDRHRVAPGEALGDAGRSRGWSASRRAPAGRCRPAARAASTASPGAMTRSAPRSALRRWANAASTTAKTCSRVTVVVGRVAAGPGDQAGVDVGGRPEDVAADGAGAAYVGVPGGLDRRDAVHLGAGRGGQPVGDLGLHHHQPALAATAAGRAGAAAPAPRRCRAGWRPARSAAARARRRRAARRRARPRSGRPGRARTPRSSRAAGRRAWRRARSRRRGRRPRAGPASATRGPGPTSITTSSAVMPDSRTMRRTVLASMTKFCPRCLVGRRSSSAASERTSAGPSRRGTAEVSDMGASVVSGGGSRFAARCRSSAREAERGGTGRPGAVPAGGVADLGGDGDLGLAAGVARQPGAAVGVPGAEVELQAAVVAVAGVDGPVAAGLALREPVPDACCRRRSSRPAPWCRP